MYYHYDAILISLAFLFVLLFDFRSHYSRHDVQDRMLLACVVSAIFCCLLEIVVDTLVEFPGVPTLCIVIAFFLYYAFIALPCFTWLCYTVSVAETDESRIRKDAWTMSIPCIAWVFVVVWNLFSGSIYSISADGAYVHGPLFGIQMVYFFIIAFIFLVYVVRSRKKFPAGQMAIISGILPVALLVGMILQTSLPGWLTMYPAYAVVLLVDYFFIENKRTADTFNRLSEKVETDSMTGLLNRAGVRRSLQRRAGEASEQSGGLFMIVNVDDLKRINDMCGHPEGDHAIKWVAQALRDHFRSSDIIGRLSGDEFVAFLPMVTSREAIEPKISSFMERVGRCTIGDGSIPLQISIGAVFATLPDDIDFDILYNRADRALYNVKHTTKNAYAFYQES